MMSYISVHDKNHKFKFLCYKSEVKTFDPSGDSTLPTYPKKRKIEQVDKEDEVIEKKAKKAKVKIEVEEEEVEDVEEQETSVKKKRKDKKKHVKEEPLAEEEPCTSTAVAVCLFLIINILLTWAEFPYFILLCMLEINR